MTITSDDLMKSLLNRLYIVITGGGLEGFPVDTDNFVTWMAPGIPFKDDFFDFASLPPSMALPAAKPDEGATEQERQRAEQLWRYAACANEWALLANFVHSAKPLTMTADFHQALYHKTDETLWQVFDETLRMSQVAVSQLTDAEKAKVEKFRNLLSVTTEKVNPITDEKKKVTEDGPVLVLYKEKAKLYSDAYREYKEAEIAFNNAESADAVNRWRFLANNLRQSVSIAWDDWVTNGYKNDVEAMFAYINEVTQRDMATIKANIQEKFRMGLQTGPNGDFYYTSVVPGDFARSRGWTKFEFGEGSYSHYAEQESTSWGARGGVHFGLYSVGASAGGSTQTTESNFDSKNFHMSFEFTQVPIARGWFESGFITGKGWKWSKDYIGDDLSDGQLPPTGRLVAYPTAALFVRNVVIRSDSFSANQSTYQSHLSAGGSFGWGPFSIGGSYTHDDAHQQANSRFTNEGLRIEGMQLIGFISHFFPKSPNPSSQAHFDD